MFPAKIFGVIRNETLSAPSWLSAIIFSEHSWVGSDYRPQQPIRCGIILKTMFLYNSISLLIPEPKCRANSNSSPEVLRTKCQSDTQTGYRLVQPQLNQHLTECFKLISLTFCSRADKILLSMGVSQLLSGLRECLGDSLTINCFKH